MTVVLGEEFDEVKTEKKVSGGKITRYHLGFNCSKIKFLLYLFVVRTKGWSY